MPRSPTITHHLLVSLAMQPRGEHGHNEHVDDEGYEEGDAGLDEEVFVGLFHFGLLGAVYCPGLGGERKWRL